MDGLRFGDQPLPQMDGLASSMKDLASALKGPPIPTPRPNSVAGVPVPTGRPSREIDEIDQRLNALAETKRQVEGAFAISPTPESIGALRAIGDEMGTLLERRATLEEPINATANLNVAPLVSSVAAGIAAVDRLKAAAASVGGPASGSVQAGASVALDGKRAVGGPVKAGGLYMVNEKGQEVWSPGSDGYVHDASTSRDMMQAGGKSSSRGAGQTARTAPTVHIPMTFNLTFGSGRNAEDFLSGAVMDRIERELQRRTRDAISGIYVDIENSVA